VHQAALRSLSAHGMRSRGAEMTEEQTSVIRSAHLMLQMLSSTFPNPSTSDPSRGAAESFALLLERARAAFSGIKALTTITAPSSGDGLPSLIAALSLLVGALPDLPGDERPVPGHL